MARPTKQGLDYFPLDVGFYGDKNIRILKARYRADGIAVYIKLLCDIYKEGYFLPVERWNDYIYVIADEIGATVDKVEQVITFLRSRAMVRIYEKDELTGYDLDAVITSHGIQKRYAAAIKSRKKSIDEIKRGFWLLSEDEEKEINAFYKSTKNGSFSEINPNKSEINPNKSEINTIKENKVNNICTDVQEDKRAFFEKYPVFQDCTGVDDSCVNYSTLLNCFERSKKFLQTRHVFAWVVDHYNEIISGKYDDLPEAEPVAKAAATVPPNVQAANEKAERERFYANRKNRAETKAENAKAAAMKNPDFAKAAKELARLEIAKARAELREPSAVADIDENIKQARRQRSAALSTLGIPERDLMPKWFCSKCSDTGFLPNGKACDCYENAKR